MGWLPSHRVLRARQLAQVRPRCVREFPLVAAVVVDRVLLDMDTDDDADGEAGAADPAVPVALRPAMGIVVGL